MLAKIVRDVAAEQRPSSYADLKPAVRRRLTALRVTYRQCDLDRAINLVAAGGRLLSGGARRRVPTIAVVDEVAPVTKEDAKRLLAIVEQRTGVRLATWP